MPTHEDRIRDLLSTRLDVIEYGLSLIRVNYALPNSEGTRGFIDILARDRHGILVIIELKRSNSTAREALHEVMKYTELMQRERGIENRNIRAIIISTHWDELRVPFSHFKRGWENDIRGYALTLAEDHVTPVKADEVRVLPEMPLRGVTPIHLIVFENETNSLESIWRKSTQALAEVGADDVLGIEFASRRDGSSFLYFVIGAMVADDPRTTRLDDLVEEESEDTIDVPDGYALEYHALSYLYRVYNYTEVEIETAHPEKFGSVLEGSRWQIGHVHRAGIFAHQKDLYPDDLIVEKIWDHDGQSQIRYTGSSRPSNQAHYVSFRRNIAYCRGEKEAWHDPFFAWLDEVAVTTPDRDVLAKIFNPCDFMMALVGGWPGRLNDYLPSLEAAVDAARPEGRMLFGTLTWDGTSVDILSAVHSVYAEPFEWAISRVIELPWIQDRKLLKRLHLNYSIFEWSDEFEEGALLKLKGGRLKRMPPDYSDERSPMWNSARPLPDFMRTHYHEIERITADFRSIVSFPMIPPNGNWEPF